MAGNATDDSTKDGSALVETMYYLESVGLNRGKAGNASRRCATRHYQITPSGIAPRDLTSASMVVLSLDHKPDPAGAIPSSEWRMHQDIYLARPDVGAIVHTHSNYATALACVGRSIPAFHYMVAVAGGDSIRCAPYATFGTQALSDHAVRALENRQACLLANHGVVALGANPLSAAKLALEVEQLARQYCIALQLGEPVILSDEQMCEVMEKFKTYGQRVE
ncbi:MAG: L-fuculose-phosphate aldolase [Gammaproteobacteria bacterium]|jgi:L-fuculose-phosphate aldolase